MKRAIQTNVRKVYGAGMQPIQQQQQQQQHQDNQMIVGRKIHNLLSSGAVTVTGPSQSRILKQKVVGTGATIQTNQNVVPKCYVCDEPANNQPTLLAETVTATSNTKLPNKIGQILGQGYMVVISVDDLVCKRCVAMINHLDRLEADSERVKKNVLNFLTKKYNLSEDDGQLTIVPSSPPVKMQRMNSGNVINRKINDDDQDNMTRKITVHSVQTTRDPVDNQLSNIFESGDNKQITVTQAKVATPPHQQQQNAIQQQQQQQVKKGQMKIYKCLSCDFKTTDYKQFQPHYETCRQNQFQCKICKKMFSNNQALKQHTAEKHTTDFSCNLCGANFLNEITLKKHFELNHPELKVVETSIANTSTTHVTTTSTPLYSCSMCQHKTNDKQNYDEHIKKHAKTKPFKCRLCSVRFETREQASVHAKTHQPNYFKCGTCSASFTQREQLVKHFETHQPQNKVQIQQQQQPQQQQQQQQPQQQQQQQIMTTQKLLQDTIDEALREPSEGLLDTKGIHFFSCNVCSVTFVQENYYNQHMETHKRDNNKKSNITTVTTQQNLVRQETRNTNSNVLTSTPQSNTILETDIESIFEKMHSDKAENENSSSGQTNENLVITSQENSVGGITFNITIPQENTTEETKKIKTEEPSTSSASEAAVSVGIDMPVLDEPAPMKTESEVPVSESDQQNQQMQQAPVSMPSLDDEGDSQSQPSNTDQVPMDLDDMQNSVEGSQIKFILNENGQILQLDNHIITTDADGNQILVQGTDSEQLQQLLQSVGVLQTGDGLDGETLQMIGENNQMIIVQQGDNEAQLIDASLLNADGHIVIQQAQDGELSEGAHVPVSVAFATHEQSLHLEGNSVEQDSQQQQQQQQQNESNDHQIKEDDEKKIDITQQQQQQQQNGVSSDQNIVVATTSSANTQQTLTTSSGETFFALEELMQQPEQKSSE